MLALEIAERFFDLDIFDVTEQRPGLLDGFVVARQHQNRHAEASDQKAVQTILPNRQAVYPHILKGRNPGMAEDAVLSSGFGVIADKQGPIKAGVETFELA